MTRTDSKNQACHLKALALFFVFFCYLTAGREKRDLSSCTSPRSSLSDPLSLLPDLSGNAGNSNYDRMPKRKSGRAFEMQQTITAVVPQKNLMLTENIKAPSEGFSVGKCASWGCFFFSSPLPVCRICHRLYGEPCIRTKPPLIMRK